MEKRRQLTQAIINNEEIVISIGKNEWKTTKEHWNEALREKKPIQHNNISIKTSIRTIPCTTDDSTRVAKQLTESYSEWFAPHGAWRRMVWQWDKDFKEGKTKVPLIYARSTGNDTNQEALYQEGKRRRAQLVKTESMKKTTTYKHLLENTKEYHCTQESRKYWTYLNTRENQL